MNIVVRWRTRENGVEDAARYGSRIAAKKIKARYAHKKSGMALRCRTASWDDGVDLVLNLQ